jgi:hypothetical protein
MSAPAQQEQGANVKTITGADNAGVACAGDLRAFFEKDRDWAVIAPLAALAWTIFAGSRWRARLAGVFLMIASPASTYGTPSCGDV